MFTTIEKMAIMKDMGEVSVYWDRDEKLWMADWTIGGVLYQGKGKDTDAAVAECITKSHREAVFAPKKGK